jgi:hypothetical protein
MIRQSWPALRRDRRVSCIISPCGGGVRGGDGLPRQITHEGLETAETRRAGIDVSDHSIRDGWERGSGVGCSASHLARNAPIT